MRNQYTWLLLGAATSTLNASVSLAQADAAPKREAKLDEKVTVTGTRQPRKTGDVPVTVTVIDEKKIDDRLVTDIKELVRFEPGVSVRQSPARFTAAFSSTGRDGNSGFNIRGLEGNRVLIQVDGIRIPDGFSFGAQTVGRGDYVDLALLKQVEIVRGPTSALYGSDGVAGAVSFVTKDPKDFLSGRETGVQGAIGYASADEGLSLSVIGAAASDAWSVMGAYTHRDFAALRNQGVNDSADSTRTTPNPQESRSNAFLGKIVYDIDGDSRIRLTLDHQDQDHRWEVLSGRALPPLGASSVIDLDAQDDISRDRVALDYAWSGEGLIEAFTIAGYFQMAETQQFSAEDRNISPDRTRRNTFDNSILGITAEAQSSFAIGATAHSLVYGFDWSQTRQEGIRDGTVPPFGETFPTRAFPNTDYTLAGAFIQDEIKLFDGRVALYPAVRIDYYELSPEADPLYVGATPAASDDTHVSPKFGAVFKLDDEISLFGNWAVGFKAPAPDQVNNGFTNIAQNYQSIPNPNLKPETSKSFEAGVRYVTPGLSASLTAYKGDYKDFISQIQVGGTFTPLDPAVFQFVNLSNVRIHGYEAHIDAEIVEGLTAIAAFSFTEGDVGLAGSPLDSVEPWKLSGGLRYADPSGWFGGQILVLHSAEKRAEDASCAPGCFRPDAFSIIDIPVWVEVTEGVKLRAAVMNLTDEKYIYWGDIRGVSAASTVIDAYTQPGRNYSLSLTVSL
jgi:hemoglobin/transferrin/lactoferrin receptor protein